MKLYWQISVYNESLEKLIWADSSSKLLNYVTTSDQPEINSEVNSFTASLWYNLFYNFQAINLNVIQLIHFLIFLSTPIINQSIESTAWHATSNIQQIFKHCMQIWNENKDRNSYYFELYENKFLQSGQ